jgi:hypothetical protein
MMNVDENVDNLKHYAGTTCILEPSNRPTPFVPNLAPTYIIFNVIGLGHNSRHKLRQVLR